MVLRKHDGQHSRGLARIVRILAARIAHHEVRVRLLVTSHLLIGTQVLLTLTHSVPDRSDAGPAQRQLG